MVVGAEDVVKLLVDNEVPDLTESDGLPEMSVSLVEVPLNDDGVPLETPSRLLEKSIGRDEAEVEVKGAIPAEVDTLLEEKDVQFVEVLLVGVRISLVVSDMV